MQKYRFYIIIIIGYIILIIGVSNSKSSLGLVVWGIGVLIAFIGVLFELSAINKRSNFYEFMIFSSHKDFIDNKIQDLQNDGWEIAGNADVTFNKTQGAAFIYIPMKRKIKKPRR